MKEYFAHPTAVIDEPADIGAGTKIWHFAHIFGDTVIGEGCIFGQNTMVSAGVTIGNNVKVQNNVSICPVEFQRNLETVSLKSKVLDLLLFLTRM